MTTTVTIKHEGPDHHGVAVTNSGGTETYLAPGESATFHVYDIQTLTISEVEKRVPAPQPDSGGGPGPDE